MPENKRDARNTGVHGPGEICTVCSENSILLKTGRIVFSGTENMRTPVAFYFLYFFSHGASPNPLVWAARGLKGFFRLSPGSRLGFLSRNFLTRADR